MRIRLPPTHKPPSHDTPKPKPPVHKPSQPLSEMARRLRNQGMLRNFERVRNMQARQPATSIVATTQSLPVSKPGDAAEREADAVAEQAVSGSSAANFSL
jgi:hypothetical protein